MFIHSLLPQGTIAWIALLSLKAAILTAVVMVLRRLLAPTIPSAWRHALWLPVLACLLFPIGPSIPLPSTLVSGLSAWASPLVKIRPDYSARTADAEALSSSVGTQVLRRTETARAGDKRSGGSWFAAMQSWLLLIWALGALTLGGAYLHNSLKFRRRRLTAHPVSATISALLSRCQADLHLPGNIKLLESSEIESPMVVGWWRATLLLPAGLQERLAPARLRLVLLHELAHVKRHDVLFNWLAALTQLLHWFNPCVWVATRALRTDMELACDASVLGHIAQGEREGYGEMLVEMADSRGGPNTVPYALGVADRISDLKGRLVMIAGFRVASARHRLVTALTIAVFTGVGLLQLSLTAPARAQSPAATAPTVTEASLSQSPQLLLEQTRPQTEVAISAADFDKFAGYYQSDLIPGLYSRVFRTGSHYYAQLTGQSVVEFFPESPTEFFATIVAAQISFVAGPDGQIDEMLQHQNGYLRTWTRMSQAEYEAAASELAQRISRNTPSPGTHDSLQRWIEAMQNGQPDYEEMSPALAAAAREQWPRTQLIIQRLQPLQSLTFERVAPNGFDVYLASFAHGSADMLIAPLSPDGKVTGQSWRVLP